MGNRNKLRKLFGDGPVGVSDVPRPLGHKLQATYEWRGDPIPGREDRRSWKRRRKTRWRVQ